MTDREERALTRAITGTDRQWWNHSGGFCGGCGSDECHPGVGCTAGDACRYCPDRGGDLNPPAPKRVHTPDPNQSALFPEVQA